jgi:hypothetical protein
MALGKRGSSVRSKNYLAFVASPAELPLGHPLGLFIKDLSPGRKKYDARFVKAVVLPEEKQLPGDDKLFLSSLAGKLYPRTFVIKIVEELAEYVPGEPYSRHRGVFSLEEDMRGSWSVNT